MSTLYRIEVSTFWKHPEMDFGRWRQQVYDFAAGTLIHDERSWADGQDFYDPKHSPHIYADKEKADAVFDELTSLWATGNHSVTLFSKEAANT